MRWGLFIPLLLISSCATHVSLCPDLGQEAQTRCITSIQPLQDGTSDSIIVTIKDAKQKLELCADTHQYVVEKYEVCAK